MIYVNMILYGWETQGSTQTTLSEFLFSVTDPGLPACSPGQPSSPSTGPTAGLAARWPVGRVIVGQNSFWKKAGVYFNVF